MKRIIMLFLSFVLILSVSSCSTPSDNKTNDSSNPSEQTTPKENNDIEDTAIKTNSNFSSTGGQVLYHDGYTYLISGHAVHSSTSANGDNTVHDSYSADFELLRISDDKSAAAEVLHTFEMIMPQYLFFSNGRIWFTEVLFDSEEGYTSLSMGSIKPDGTEYKVIPSNNVTISKTKVLGESDGKLYFQERTEDNEVIYHCFNANTGKWESFLGEYESSNNLMILTVDCGYAYYAKLTQVGGGEEVGLWRAKIADGTSELLTRLTEDEMASNWIQVYMVTNEYFYFVNNNKIYAVSFETGDILTVVENTDNVYACNATNDGLYYMNDEGLYFTSPKGNDTELKLKNEDSDMHFMWLAICGDWFVYTDNDTTHEFYRVKNTATQLPKAYFYKER